jgi:hypothetical protein
MPARLLQLGHRTIPHVIDEIAFQPRRGLAQRALADIIRFSRDDEREIRRGAASLVRGVVPADLPPRFLVSASRYAIGQGAAARQVSRLVTHHLAGVAAGDDRTVSSNLMAA